MSCMVNIFCLIAQLATDIDCLSVVLMDELDQLVTPKQDVIYNFFNWPTLVDNLTGTTRYRSITTHWGVEQAPPRR